MKSSPNFASLRQIFGLLLPALMLVLPVRLSAQDPSSLWPPVPKSSGQKTAQRLAMVEKQLANPKDGRSAIRSQPVLEAMRIVPRHMFVPKGLRTLAHLDRPLPIAKGQTISQPYIVALMTELLELDPESKVLEIGTGSGYQAAVLAHLTRHVYSVEIDADLHKSAASTLQDEGYHLVRLLRGDGFLGWPQHAPYDAIMVTCATAELPQPLVEQLKPGGRLVLPLGSAARAQELVLFKKDSRGQLARRAVIPVLFVPMTRE